MHHKAIRIAVAVLKIDPSLLPVVNGILNVVAGFAIVPAFDRGSGAKTWAVYPLDGSADAIVVDDDPTTAEATNTAWKGVLREVARALGGDRPDLGLGWILDAIGDLKAAGAFAAKASEIVVARYPHLKDDRLGILRAIETVIGRPVSIVVTGGTGADPDGLPGAEELARIFEHRYLSNAPESAGMVFVRAGCVSAFRGMPEDPTALAIEDGMHREYWRKGHAIGRSLVNVRAVVGQPEKPNDGGG